MIINQDTTDEVLVEYIRTTDKEYFSYIIDRYEEKLKRYIGRLSNYSADTEDILQDVFVKTFMNLHAFNINKKFSSWIYRIAHNHAINWLKKNRVNMSLDENEFIENKLISKIDVRKDFEEKEAYDEILKKINKLPDKYKEPFILKYFEDKTYDEISEILRKPKNTVGTMINRAKKILKNEIKNI
jgi:RNA polymerase sigma-70 factor (ECF subfamily)